MHVLNLRVGEPVLHQGQRCLIAEVLDSSRCLVRPDEENASRRPAFFHELVPVPESIPAKNNPESLDLSGVPDPSKAEARRRMEILRPLLAMRRGRTRAIHEAAPEHGISPATIYRWMKAFKRTQLLVSLIPMYALRGGPLKSRLKEEVDLIVQEVIDDFHLKEERPSDVETALEVKARCVKKGLKPPSASTVRNRILAINLRVVSRKRFGKKSADRYRPLLGTLPGAERPWSIIHIDHTLLDIILVDRVTRRPIGRPTITVALDAASRMVVGFCISLDKPRYLSVGRCLIQAMLPKEKWLAHHKIEGNWPVWGKPETIHLDNAKEFTGTMIQRGCGDMGISIHYRRAGTPQDGGRIERFIRTLNGELHRLPGSTFSNPKDRGEYKSEKYAAMTLDELEVYVGDWIVNTYHRGPHRGLNGRSPLQTWNSLLSDGDLGINLPPRYVDEDAVRLLFLHSETRKLHRHGIDFKGIAYWSDHLNHVIGTLDPDDVDTKPDYVIRYDPRDISKIWFYDPKLKQHIELPYRDLTHPPISLWEAEEAKKLSRKEGFGPGNEDALFAARDRRQAIAAQSVQDTKASRRQQERALRHQEEAAKELPKGRGLRSQGEVASPEPPIQGPAERPTEKARLSPAAFAFDENDD